MNKIEKQDYIEINKILDGIHEKTEKYIKDNNLTFVPYDPKNNWKTITFQASEIKKISIKEIINKYANK